MNRRFLDDVRARYPGDLDRVRRISLIQESPEKRVRMAHLAVVGSHSTNGVAAIHSDLLGRTVLKDLAEHFPDRFNNTDHIFPAHGVGANGTNIRIGYIMAAMAKPDILAHFENGFPECFCRSRIRPPRGTNIPSAN